MPFIHLNIQVLIRSSPLSPALFNTPTSGPIPKTQKPQRLFVVLSDLPAEMVSGPPSHLCPVQPVSDSGHAEGGSADPHAPSPFSPSDSEADIQDTSPTSLTDSVASAQAPKTPLINSGPTDRPLRLHSQGILKQSTKANQVSQSTCRGSLNKLVAGCNERAAIVSNVIVFLM